MIIKIIILIDKEASNEISLSPALPSLVIYIGTPVVVSVIFIVVGIR
jgi:hypothetical protein